MGSFLAPRRPTESDGQESMDIKMESEKRKLTSLKDAVRRHHELQYQCICTNCIYIHEYTTHMCGCGSLKLSYRSTSSYRVFDVVFEQHIIIRRAVVEFLFFFVCWKNICSDILPRTESSLGCVFIYGRANIPRVDYAYMNSMCGRSVSPGINIYKQTARQIRKR